MIDDNSNHNNNPIINLKMLSQEELELRVDSLLAKCRAEVDIKTTAERGAMFRKGPFQISISLAVKMKKYQDELLYCRRNPYDVLLSVCTDNGWGAPEFRAVDYMLGEGFLFSVVVNDHELVSKWRDRRPLLAADLAAANFLRYLGLWVNVKNLNFFFDWEQITSQGTGSQKKEVGNINGYLYFMGFNVVKTEETGGEKTSTSILSLRPNIHLQLAKLMYIFLTCRGERVCWLTDIDIAYFKRIFGELEPDASYAFHNASWKSNVVCSCRKKRSKICFGHEEYFLYFMLKDYFFVDKFGPVDLSVFEKLKEMKKETEEMVKTDRPTEEAAQETKSLIHEAIFEKLKHIKQEGEATNYTKDTLQEAKTFIYEKAFEQLKHVKTEDDDALKNYSEETSKQKEIFSHRETINKGQYPIKKLPTSPIEFDPTETPVNLREKKFDLKSKIFGKAKVEDTVEEEKVDFKISFDIATGRSNIKSSVGGWITVADISPPHIPIAVKPSKRPCSITVVTSKRKKKKVK